MGGGGSVLFRVARRSSSAKGVHGGLAEMLILSCVVSTRHPQTSVWLPQLGSWNRTTLGIHWKVRVLKSSVPLVHSHASEPCSRTRRGNETFEGVKTKHLKVCSSRQLAKGAHVLKDSHIFLFFPTRVKQLLIMAGAGARKFSPNYFCLLQKKDRPVRSAHSLCARLCSSLASRAPRRQ